jgi:hypothetical protein
MTTATISTPAGTRVQVEILTGYVLHQYRPYECKTWLPDPANPGHYSARCKCGKCDGQTLTVAGTYQGTTHYADNSVAGTVALDEPLPNGRRYHVVEFVGAHGDCC